MNSPKVLRGISTRKSLHGESVILENNYLAPILHVCHTDGEVQVWRTDHTVQNRYSDNSKSFRAQPFTYFLDTQGNCDVNMPVPINKGCVYGGPER